MKNDKLISSIGAILTIAGCTMRILHLPYGGSVLIAGLLVTAVFQSWHVTVLKKRIKELESKAN